MTQQLFMGGFSLSVQLFVGPPHLHALLRVYEHIANVEACFRGALSISTGPLPALINEATEEIYSDLGWCRDDVADGSKPL